MNTKDETQPMLLVIKMYDILFILIQNNAKYNGILLLSTKMRRDYLYLFVGRIPLYGHMVLQLLLSSRYELYIMNNI